MEKAENPPRTVRLVVTSTIVLLFALPAYLLWSDIALEERLLQTDCTVLTIDSDFVVHTDGGRQGAAKVTGASAYLRLSLEHIVDGRSWMGEATTDKVKAGSGSKLPTYEKGQTVDCWYDPESLGGKLWLRKANWRDQTYVHITLFASLWFWSALLLVKRRAVESTIAKVPHAYLITALGIIGVGLPFIPGSDIPLPFRIVILAAGFMAMFRGLKLLALSERGSGDSTSTRLGL